MQRPTMGDDRDAPCKNRNYGEVPLGEISTITGGFTGGGTFASTRKVHARKAGIQGSIYDRQATQADEAKEHGDSISFGEED